MTRILDYVGRQVKPRLSEDSNGRRSCVRAMVSVAVLLAYLCFIVWCMPEDSGTPTATVFRKLDFFIKRVIPGTLLVVAAWGMYYGIVGVARDRSRVLAIAGLAMNTVCLFFHGMVTMSLVSEVYQAYRFYHGVIQVMTR